MTQSYKNIVDTGTVTAKTALCKLCVIAIPGGNGGVLIAKNRTYYI